MSSRRREKDKEPIGFKIFAFYFIIGAGAGASTMLYLKEPGSWQLVIISALIGGVIGVLILGYGVPFVLKSQKKHRRKMKRRATHSKYKDSKEAPAVL